MPIHKYLLLFIILFLSACGDSNSDKMSPPVVEPPVIEPPVIEPPVTPLKDKILVESSSPINHASDVSINSIIEVIFNLEIDSSALDIEYSLFTEGEEVDGKLIVNNKSLTFIPNEKLLPNQKYLISLRSSSNSEKTIDAIDWDFTTSKEVVSTRKSFFPEIQEKGSTVFTLQPIDGLKENEIYRASFGIPFPRGYLNDLSLFQIFDSEGNEVPVYAQSLLPWQSDKSIRSVLVQLDVSFNLDESKKLTPKDYILKWGSKRALVDLDSINIKDTWGLVNDHEFSADELIYEPKVYALFTPEWYGDSVIKTRLLPFGSHSQLSANDISFELFGDTAINYVDPRVIDDNLYPYKGSYASWLFDRAMTLYQLAFRSGEFKYLRAAHRASQFYLQKINEEGYFSLKTSNDMKYSYGESLLTNFILTGDDRVPSVIEKMLPAWEAFKTEYTLDSNFWTERHVAYQLLGFVTAYEILGTEELKNKAINVFNTLRKMQVSPAPGLPITGGLMHTSASHSEGGDELIASPWMSVILVSAIERYYIQFNDENVPGFIMRLADFFSQKDVSFYEWKGDKGDESFYVPHKLAGDGLSLGEHDGFGSSDIEHAPDVTKIFSLAYFFSCITECDQAYLDTLSIFNNSAITFTFPKWIRTAAPKLGFTSYRLAPPRKFNWWFQHTANNDFLIGSNTPIPFYKKQVAELEVIQSHDFNGRFKPGDEITFTYKLKNKSIRDAKNVVVTSNLRKMSPEGLVDVIAVDEKGIDISDVVVWRFDKIKANTSVDDLTLTIKVNNFPTLQSLTRPIGNILSYVNVYYCDNDDKECVLSNSEYDLGHQTISIQSDWKTIKPIQAVTPPIITSESIVDGDLLSGLSTISMNVVDTDGIDHVDYYLDDKLVSRMTTLPYEYQLQTDALSADDHVFSIKAWDIFGSEAHEDIKFTVQNPDTASPEVEISSPNLTVSACDDIKLQYSVTEPFLLQSCQLILDESILIDEKCSDHTVPKIFSLFSALSNFSFEGTNDVVTSNALVALIGTPGKIERVKGYDGNALSFSGSNSFIDFEGADLNIENNLSISFWMKPTVDEAVIMSQDWYYIGEEKGWAVSLGANNHESNNPWSITWSSGDNALNLNAYNIVQTAPNTIKGNIWQHVVVRKKDTLIDIFIDGTLAISKHISSGKIRWPFDSKQTLSFGKAMDHTEMYNRYYQGLLDEVTIWNKVISDAEVEQLYTRTPSLGDHKFSVIASDGAGNKGSASVDFNLTGCQ